MAKRDPFLMPDGTGGFMWVRGGKLSKKERLYLLKVRMRNFVGWRLIRFGAWLGAWLIDRGRAIEDPTYHHYAKKQRDYIARLQKERGG